MCEDQPVIVASVPVPVAGFSAVLSLLTLNISTPIGISFSAGLTIADVFNVYGTLDAAAIDATNATSIGRIAGTSGGNLDPIFVEKMIEWPYVILERVSGGGAGTFDAAGNPDTGPAVASTALPTVGAFTALLNMTAFQSMVRIGTSRQQTAADVFDVFVINDATTNPAVTGTAGAWYAGRIAGGGERAGSLSSLIVEGYAYAFIQRFAGTTAGNMLAAGASPLVGPAGPPGPPGQAPIATGTGQTVNNATVAILIWTPPLNSTTVIRECLSDNGATAGQAYSFVQYVTIRRDAGAPRIVGSVSPIHVARDNNSAQAPIAIVGNNVEFRARGVNLQTINWVCAIYKDSI